MKRILSSEIKDHIGEQIMLRGWFYNLRKLGKLNFLLLRDREGIAQVVIEDKDELAKIKDIQVGCVLEIVGLASEAKQLDSGAELTVPTIRVLNLVTEPMPVTINKSELKANLDTILDYRPLTLRHQSYQAIFKIQATLAQAYREYLIGQGFTEFFGPNIIGASSEGGSELFKVKYFNEEAMLSQSAQLYKQMMVGVYERVFALMKCFRAEKSNTRRHLTEATQFEFEMGFIDSFTEVMDMLEEVVKYMIKTVKEKNVKELEILGVELALAPLEVKFPRITFKEALQLVKERTGVDETKEIDLSPFAEKELCAYAREQFGTDFIFVTNFLRVKTAFYAQPSQKDPETSNYFDLLCREIEICSGGQRIHELELLEESMRAKGLDPADFTDYLSIFKYGMPKHGGFGMGLERFTMMALGLDNIRHSTLFPSDPKRIAAVGIAQKVYYGQDLTDEIERRLKENGIQYELLEHEAVRTSEEAAVVRKTKLSEGVKALILRNIKDGTNIMVCVPADQKLDFKQINALENSRFELEKSDQIKSKYGLEVGGVPPFGNLLAMKTYFSKAVVDNERSAFNCGSPTKSIVMKSADLIKLVDPVVF